MAFNTGTGTSISLDRAFEAIEGVAFGIKNLSQALSDRSAAGNVTGEHIQRYFDNLGDKRNELQSWAAKMTDMTAATAYARDRYNDPAYDAQAEYTALLAQINATLSFIATNIPSDLIVWDDTNGYVDWVPYNSGQTAGLRAQLQALVDAID